jgi:hypothetical protein
MPVLPHGNLRGCDGDVELHKLRRWPLLGHPRRPCIVRLHPVREWRLRQPSWHGRVHELWGGQLPAGNGRD